MTDKVYETIKGILVENERLFEKLHRVAGEYDAIEFDESGFYDEEVARCERHWNTLSRKVADGLNTALENAEVRLLESKAPNICTLRFDITTRDEEDQDATTRITIDYATPGQIAVSHEG